MVEELGDKMASGKVEGLEVGMEGRDKVERRLRRLKEKIMMILWRTHWATRRCTKGVKEVKEAMVIA